MNMQMSKAEVLAQEQYSRTLTYIPHKHLNIGSGYCTLFALFVPQTKSNNINSLDWYMIQSI